MGKEILIFCGEWQPHPKKKITMLDILNNTQNRNINITISLSDLREFLTELISANRQNEKATEDKEKEVEMVSRDEASEFLKVSLCTLWRWEREKYLIPTRIGKAVYYRKCDLKAIKEGTR